MRSNKFVISLFKNTYTKEALDHNMRSHNIEYYNYTPDEIKVEVTAHNITQHKIWLSWFTFLHHDILRANTYLKEFHFPILDYKIKKANGVEYNVQELRFEIDEKGGIWNIISQSIYTDKLDFLRELIQNAIDASLMEIYNTNSIVIDFKSPRSWNAREYNKNVIVGYSEKSNQLYVIDYGTGMSELDLRNFLFRVSGSGRANSNIRDFEFPAIAKYGIGFISCLINAESIKIYTRKFDDNEMHYVSLESNSNLAFMENIASEKFSGTAILLDLKNKFTFSEIQNYIENTFKYASVGIYCIDVDAIYELSKVFQMSDEFDMLSLKPYMLNELCSRLTKKREKITEPILQETRTFGRLCTDVENLITWIDDHKEYDVKYSDKKKLKDFKKQVTEISTFIESNNLEHKFPIKADEVNEKSLLTTREYTPQVENYYSEIRAKLKETTQEVKKYPTPRNLVHNLRLHLRSDDKYIIAFIDENLQISRVICTNEIIDLSNKTGIVILNHQAADYNSGYEYTCINAFLFHNGEICNTIAKFNRKKLIYSIGSWKNDKIVGSYYDYNEAWYGLEEDISNRDFWESDYRYESDDIYEDVYDVIYIENNKFMFNYGVQSVKSNLYYNDNEEKHHTSFVNSIIDIYSKNQVDNENAVLFRDITCNLESEYYQDGIKIPFNLEDLIPFGYFKIICNCTADSRMALNVTRHKTSEIPQDIDSWMISAGKKIQNSIMKSIKDMLDALHLTIDFKELKQRCSNNYLATLCLKNIHEINK